MAKPCDVRRMTYDSLIAFNNGLGHLKTKLGGGFPRRKLGVEFVLRDPNSFFISVQIVMCLKSHG